MSSALYDWATRCWEAESVLGGQVLVARVLLFITRDEQCVWQMGVVEGRHTQLIVVRLGTGVGR
jgi:hypothetical protein